MTEYALSYNATTGEDIGKYSGPDGTAAIQILPDGYAQLIVPLEAWVVPPNLEIIRALLCARVDAAAGAFRSRFITVSPGQEATYIRKEDEARRYAASSGAGDYPFLSAEASATGMTLADVAALVLSTANQWVPLGAAIEGQRRAAKLAIEAATTIPAIVAAATVDWDALLP
jgi:hypothetical protein